ncbi:MAG: hypothetical protein RLZZ387_2093 [Chloroflexota bacterium]|jgi:hypothetical protein
MSNVMHPGGETLQQQFLAEIDHRERGRWKVSIVRVMQSFGFNIARTFGSARSSA